MKSKDNLLERLKVLPHFNKKTLVQLGQEFSLKVSTLDTYISRYLKYREIYKLKNGIYTTADFFDKNKGNIAYTFYLANICRPSSYLSSWTALQYYNLTTEATYPVTSVSLKTTKKYSTKVGDFFYQSISPKYFTDFSLKKDKFDFYIASPSKALFDLLYFRENGFRGFDKKNIPKLLEELRIDFEEMGVGEQDNFYKLINNLK